MSKRRKIDLDETRSVLLANSLIGSSVPSTNKNRNEWLKISPSISRFFNQISTEKFQSSQTFYDSGPVTRSSKTTSNVSTSLNHSTLKSSAAIENSGFKIPQSLPPARKYSSADNLENSLRNSRSKNLTSRTNRNILLTSSVSTLQRSISPSMPTSSKRLKSLPSTKRTTKTSCNYSETVVAIFIGRGKSESEIGIAVFDLDRPSIGLIEFSDTISYTKTIRQLLLLKPMNVIVPNSFAVSQKKLIKLLSEFVDPASIIQIDKRQFNLNHGKCMVTKICHPNCVPAIVDIKEKFYALTALSGLWRHLERTYDCDFRNLSLKVQFKISEDIMFIDYNTVKNLELLDNMVDYPGSKTLFNALNQTKTADGQRSLRATILQPLRDATKVNNRLDCIEFMLAHPDQLFHLHTLIGQCVSLNNLLNLCVREKIVTLSLTEDLKITKMRMNLIENKITNILYLKHVLNLLPRVCEILENTGCSLFKTYSQTICDLNLSSVKAQLNAVIKEDAVYNKQLNKTKVEKCFTIQESYSPVLNEERKNYLLGLQSIQEYVEYLREKHSLPFKLGNDFTRGFHLQLVGVTEGIQLPSELIRKKFSRGTCLCSTLKLDKLNSKTTRKLHEVYICSEAIISELLVNLSNFSSVLLQTMEVVGDIDLILSLCIVSKKGAFVRPVIGKTYAVHKGKHPVRVLMGSDPVTANNIFASPSQNCVILTGCPMSGKTTYLKQVALIQILAQIGCFVPAKHAQIRLCDSLFTRMGSDDNMFDDTSAFTKEMLDVSYILHSMTPESMVIIDELGRGTGAQEGIAISIGLMESFIESKAFVFMASHYNELTSLSDMSPAVECYHMSSALDRLHRLNYGREREQYEGLKEAFLSQLPPTLLEKVSFMQRRINENGLFDKSMLDVSTLKQRKFYTLAKKAFKHKSTVDPGLMRNYLTNLKDQYLMDSE